MKSSKASPTASLSLRDNNITVCKAFWVEDRKEEGIMAVLVWREMTTDRISSSMS